MLLKGWTYFTHGDPTSPDYKSDLQENDSIKSNESKILAAFAKGEGVGFYKYLAVGGGTSSLFTDPANPPLASEIVSNHLDNQTDPKLFSEFYRTPVTFTRFVDVSIPSGSNQFVEENTGVIELIWQIPNGEANGSWREIGIFAGNASSALNSGSLVHYQTIVTYDRIPSDLATKTLNWHWRVSFTG